ncbi:STM4015 family protein [Halovulum sp. GXIMD14793]
MFSNLTSFYDKPVRDFKTKGDVTDFAGTAVRLRCSYDEPHTVLSLLGELLEQPGIEQLEALIFGVWMENGESYDVSPDPAIELLVAQKHKLPNLMALFVGDIISEENEVSWIAQGDMSPLWAAFPKLEQFRARGGNGLKLGKIIHSNLSSVIIETGGMNKRTVQEMMEAQAPLTHLELWLGDEGYGDTTNLSDFDPLFEGEVFPELRSLYLNNSNYQNDLARAAANSVVVDRLQVLGLSMGELSDDGGQALLDSDRLSHLQKLDLTFHFLSKDMQAALKAAYPQVVLDDAQVPDEWNGEQHLYVAVSE